MRAGTLFQLDKRVIRGIAAMFGEDPNVAWDMPFDQLSYVKVVLVDPDHYQQFLAEAQSG